MDVINLGRMTKKEQQQNVPVGQSAVAKVVGGASKVGKSREQAVHGVTQGNRGWESQYQLPQNTQTQSPQRNVILNSLTSSPSFTMPKIQHSLLTNEGFNEALGVVGARNMAKLDMQNRRVLGGVLGSIIAGDTQRYGADKRFMSRAMEDATRRRGQDLDSEYRTNALEETKAYHNVLGKYYQGQNEIGTERNKIAAQKAAAAGQPKQLNPLDAQIKRQRIIGGVNKTGDGAEQIFGREYTGLDDDTKTKVQQRFIATGERPVGYKQVSEGGFFSDPTYEPIYQQDQAQKHVSQQQSTQQSAQQQPQHSNASGITGKMLDTLSKELNVDRGHLKISDDGSSVIFPDGSTITKDELAKITGA